MKRIVRFLCEPLVFLWALAVTLFRAVVHAAGEFWRGELFSREAEHHAPQIPDRDAAPLMKLGPGGDYVDEYYDSDGRVVARGSGLRIESTPRQFENAFEKARKFFEPPAAADGSLITIGRVLKVRPRGREWDGRVVQVGHRQGRRWIVCRCVKNGDIRVFCADDLVAATAEDVMEVMA